jgi:hypothetical protein
MAEINVSSPVVVGDVEDVRGGASAVDIDGSVYHAMP